MCYLNRPGDSRTGSEFLIFGEQDPRLDSSKLQFRNPHLKSSSIAICWRPRIINSRNYCRQGLHFTRALACCKLWLLALNREAAHAPPCGSRHKSSQDSQANHFPAGFPYSCSDPTISDRVKDFIPRKLQETFRPDSPATADCEVPKLLSIRYLTFRARYAKLASG